MKFNDDDVEGENDKCNGSIDRMCAICQTKLERMENHQMMEEKKKEERKISMKFF